MEKFSAPPYTLYVYCHFFYCTYLVRPFDTLIHTDAAAAADASVVVTVSLVSNYELCEF